VVTMEMPGTLAYPVHTIHQAAAEMHPDGLGWVLPSSAAVNETLTEVSRSVPFGRRNSALLLTAKAFDSRPQDHAKPH
jgi:hypothetical protein